MRYAFITVTPHGVEMAIGQDVIGQASHGASLGPGTYASIAQASASAQARGVAADQIYVALGSAAEAAAYDETRLVHGDPDFDPTPY
jgi:hypothetical protein